MVGLEGKDLLEALGVDFFLIVVHLIEEVRDRCRGRRRRLFERWKFHFGWIHQLLSRVHQDLAPGATLVLLPVRANSRIAPSDRHASC